MNNDTGYEPTTTQLRKDLDTCTRHLENELRLAQAREQEQASYTKQLSEEVQKLADTTASVNGEKIFWRNVSVAIFFIATALGFLPMKWRDDRPVADLMTDLPSETRNDTSGCLSPVLVEDVLRTPGDNAIIEANRMLKVELVHTRQMLAQIQEAMARKDLENECNLRYFST